MTLQPRRTPETQAAYDQAIQKGNTIVIQTDDGKKIFDLERAHIVKDFTHWALIKNDYPYDEVFEKHHLLVPRRVFSDLKQATEEEYSEYTQIMESFNEKRVYHASMDNFDLGSSVPDHIHIHVFRWKQI